jgi:hypothetical protein
VEPATTEEAAATAFLSAINNLTCSDADVYPSEKWTLFFTLVSLKKSGQLDDAIIG